MLKSLMALEHPFLTQKTDQMGLKANKPNMKEMLKCGFKKLNKIKTTEIPADLNVTLSPGGVPSVGLMLPPHHVSARGAHFMAPTRNTPASRAAGGEANRVWSLTWVQLHQA